MEKKNSLEERSQVPVILQEDSYMDKGYAWVILAGKTLNR